MHAILGSILYCALSCFVFVNNFARLKMLQAQEKIETSNEMIFNDSDNWMHIICVWEKKDLIFICFWV